MDKRAIMSRAWEIRRENKDNIFSLCLAMAWEEAKTDSLEDRIEKVKAEFYCEEKFSKKAYRNSVRRWTKYGKDRLYIPRSAYEDAGYIDLSTFETFPTRPGNASTLRYAVEMLTA